MLWPPRWTGDGASGSRRRSGDGARGRGKPPPSHALVRQGQVRRRPTSAWRIPEPGVAGARRHRNAEAEALPSGVPPVRHLGPRSIEAGRTICCSRTSSSSGWNPRREGRACRATTSIRRCFTPTAACGRRASSRSGSCSSTRVSSRPPRLTTLSRRSRARTPADGAKVVARAWTDAAFRGRLLTDARAAAGEMGYRLSHDAELAVVENTAEVHHLVVCTLCSCYPTSLLGQAAGLVQEFRVPAASGDRTPRRVCASLVSNCRLPWVSALSTAPPMCATSCCRVAHPEPKA